MSILLLAISLLIHFARSDQDNAPPVTKWGPYRIVVEKVGKEDFSPSRLRLIDPAGKTVREIDDQQFTLIELTELTGKLPKELHIAAYTGGAHCCTTDYFFALKGGLHNVLIFEAGNGGIGDIKSLTGHGRPEIIAENDCLSYFGGLSFAGSPSLVMILGWNGHAYVDETAGFPSRTLARARDEFEANILKSLKDKSEEAEEMRRFGAAGYYGSLYSIGRGEVAERWLLKRVPTSTRRWFVENERAIRQAVIASHRKARVSQAKVLKVQY